MSNEEAIKRPAKPIGKAGDRVPSRAEGCTEAVAALGLCAPKPGQKKEATTDPALQTAKNPATGQKKEAGTNPAPQAAKTPAAGGGKADGQQPPRIQACTEATAALGLCTPSPPQRKE